MGLDIQLGVKLPKNIGTSINADIKKLKISKLTIPVKIDTVSLKRVLKNLNVQFSKSNESKTLNISKNVFDVDKLQSDGRKFYISATGIVNRVKKDFSSMGKVNVTNIFKNAKGQIQGFSAELTKASGVVEKFNFEKAKLESANWNSVQSGFVQMNSVGADKLMGSDLEKKLNSLNTMEIRLANIKQNAFSLDKAITDTSHVDALNNKFKEIETSINAAKTSGDAFSSDQKRNLETLISQAEMMSKAYKSMEHPSGKAIEFVKSEELAKLKNLEKEWENQGILVGDFKNKVVDLEKSLTQAFNKTGISNYKHELTLIKEEAKSINNSLVNDLPGNALETMTRNLPIMESKIKGITADVSKLGNVPGSLIADVQNLTTQLDKVNSTIDPKEKVEEYNKLNQAILEVRNYSFRKRREIYLI